MSTPLNPLSKYRSYSYHHVLAICDCTQTAEELSESIVLGDAFLARPPSERMVVRNTTSGGKYLVLINGFTDSEYVIQNMNWGTIIAPTSASADGHNTVSTIETDGEMTILEPYGVNFLEAIPQACDALERDPINVMWLVKTFFVGHMDDGSTEVISNIRPLVLLPVDVQAEFSETGAKYIIGFVGIANGAVNAPYAQEIASQVRITNSAAGATLQTIFETDLPAIIENLYIQETNKLREQYQKTGVEFDEAKYIPVKYRFVLDPAYRGMIYGDAEKIQSQSKNGIVTLTVSSNPTFDKIIEAIMFSSKQVCQECNNEEEKYVFKTVSSMYSTPTEVTVTYYIQRFKVVTPKLDDAIREGKKFEPPPGTSLEFDYIFTGKNIDILEFDIKMEMGLAFFQTLSTTNNIPSGDEFLNGIAPGIANGGSGSAPNQKLNSSSQSAERKIPLWLGGQIKDPIIRNKMYPISVANFQSMLARHAALENIQAKVVIHGNPQLLDELSIMPTDMEKIEDGKGIRTEDPVANQTINPTWTSLPTFIKINIKMPAPYRDEFDYTKDFWYDGYFMLFAVNNVFDNGEFRQELEMFSLPYGDPFDNTTDETDSDPATEQSSSSRRKGGSYSARKKNEALVAEKEKELQEVSIEVARYEQAGIKNANPQSPDYIRYQELKARQATLTREIELSKNTPVQEEVDQTSKGPISRNGPRNVQSAGADSKDAESQSVLERRQNRIAKRT